MLKKIRNSEQKNISVNQGQQIFAKTMQKKMQHTQAQWIFQELWICRFMKCQMEERQ